MSVESKVQNRDFSFLNPLEYAANKGISISAAIIAAIETLPYIQAALKHDWKTVGITGAIIGVLLLVSSGTSYDAEISRVNLRQVRVR